MGMALGPIPIITARRDEFGWLRYAPLPDAALRRILRLADEEISDDAVERFVAGIAQVTAALNSGEDRRAHLIAT